MLPTIQPFSPGYDLGEFLVTPSDDPEPRINARLYEELQRRAAEKFPTEELEVYFRYRPAKEHFSVQPDESVRVDAIELPRKMVSFFGFDRLPCVDSFLVARPSHAKQLAWLLDMDIAPLPDQYD